MGELILNLRPYGLAAMGGLTKVASGLTGIIFSDPDPNNPDEVIPTLDPKLRSYYEQ